MDEPIIYTITHKYCVLLAETIMVITVIHICDTVISDFVLLQSKERSDREDLKTDIQHRKETFYRVSILLS